MKIKLDRVNSELAKQISKIISEDIKDPRMGSCLVGVTKLYTTPDLKYAKVYLSVYGKTEEEMKEAYYTVCRSKVFIRNRLKELVQMRLVPELNFLIDDSVSYSIKIDSILADIKKELEENPRPQEDEEDGDK